MATRKPDFALFPVSVNSASFGPCAFTVELQLPTLDSGHRGRCATYNTEMLDTNPNRSFALSAVTDLKSIMFLRTTRSTPSDAESALQHVYSDDLDVEQMGWDVLLKVLQQPSDWTGFFLPQMQFNGRPVRLLQYLGHGATSAGVALPGGGSARPVQPLGQPHAGAGLQDVPARRGLRRREGDVGGHPRERPRSISSASCRFGLAPAAARRATGGSPSRANIAPLGFSPRLRWGALLPASRCGPSS